MDYTVHEILQTRILEWVAVPFSRGSSQPRDQIQVFRIAGGCFTHRCSLNSSCRKLVPGSPVVIESNISANWVFIILIHTFPSNGLCCILGRVVNMSSGWGFKALESCSPELQQKLRSETITEEELVGLMNKFVEDTKNGVHRKEGWPDNNIYGVVKIGITALSRIQARKLSEQRGADKILLNACCPGWVRTDMARLKALKSSEEGTETPVYLALLPSDAEGPHGQFVHEKKVAKWQFLPEFYP